MSDEYVFAKSLDKAARYAKARGWRNAGRGGFVKADGTVVHLICFEQQLRALAPDATVHHCTDRDR